MNSYYPLAVLYLNYIIDYVFQKERNGTSFPETFKQGLGDQNTTDSVQRSLHTSPTSLFNLQKEECYTTNYSLQGFAANH